jgi:NAD(P) transhydrogenase subunit beta
VETKQTIAGLVYLVAIVIFILGIKRLGKVRTARRGNGMAALAMLLAIVATLFATEVVEYEWLLGGLVVGAVIGMVAALKVEMTDMPEMVALFNGSGGAASMLVALAILVPVMAGGVWPEGSTLSAIPLAAIPPSVEGAARADMLATFTGTDIGLSLLLSIIIGAVTLTGSFVAYGKLSGKVTGNAVTYPGQHAINATLIVITLAITAYLLFGVGTVEVAFPLAIAVTVLSLLLGVLLVLPIGGADMPVVISLLNSYSGIAAAMTGFVLQQNVLIVSGAMVGAAGLILTNIMCKAMNRSLLSVLLGGFGATTTVVDKAGARDYKNITSVGSEELAMLLDGVSSVIFVPGYGLAVAQAQHVVRELADFLEAADAKVRYAIHPVAGRMPGHMNVLLAESNVPYEQLVEMDEINPEFKGTEIVIVVGANDVVNPVAIDPNEPTSPLAGMPILNVHEAASVVVIKRSLSPGYAGVKNVLFDLPNTHMCFGDAKKVLAETLAELKENAA